MYKAEISCTRLGEVPTSGSVPLTHWLMQEPMVNDDDI